MTIFYAETGGASAKKFYKAASDFLSVITPFSQIKKPLLFVAALFLFAFFSSPATAQVNITTNSPAGAILSNPYTVTFTTAQTGLSASNFTVTGSATGSYVSSVTGSGTSWTVYVTTPTSFQSFGTITLNMVNSTNLTPGVTGLPVSGPTLGVINYPLTATLTFSSTNANSGYAKTGDKINFTFQSTYYFLYDWDVNIAGQNTGGNLMSSNTATGQFTLGSGTAQGAIASSWSYTNQFNENNNGSGSSTVIFDNIAPTCAISAPSASVVSGSSGTNSVSYTVSYADANFNSSSLTTSGVTLNKTGTATGTLTIGGSGTFYIVTISNISGAGTLGISVGAGHASDKAGNTDAGAGPSATTAVTANVSPAISYTSPQVYPINGAISPLAPMNTAGMSAFATTMAGSGLAPDYNGNAYIITTPGGGILEYPPGNGPPVPVPNGGSSSAANIAVAPISATTSTLFFENSGSIQAMDNVGGTFQTAVNICPNPGTGNLVAAIHPASGPEIAMIDKGLDPGGQIAFFTRTAGIWSAPAIIANSFAGSAMAINTYQGSLKLAYVGTDNNLYYAAYSGGTWSAVAPWGAPNISLSGVSTLALDAQGNVWYASGTSLNELMPGTTTPVTYATLPAAPNAIAFDISGNLYVNFGSLIEEYSLPGGFQVSPSLPAGLSLNSATGIISGTPTAVTPAANYAITATAGSSNLSANVNIQTVTTPSLSYGDALNATIGTAITPIVPTSGSITAQSYNSTPAAFASATAPTGLTVDAAGNVYVAYNGGSVEKIPAGGGAPSPVSNGYAPLATDGPGNLYISEGLSGIINGFAIFQPGATSPVLTIDGPNGDAAQGSAGMGVDAAGNVYTAGISTNTVYEFIDPLNTTVNLYVPIAIGSGFTSLSGLAVDAAGDIYVTDAGAGTIDVIPANRGQWTTLVSGLGAPANICIDGGGNLYFSDNSTNTIREIPAGSTTPVVIASGLGSITALAIDGTGKLYAADNTNGVIDAFSPTGGYYINPTLPPGFSFNGATGVISGTPAVVSAATNYTITAYNTIGSVSATQSVAAAAVLPTLSYGGVSGFTTGLTKVITPVSTGVAAQGYATVPVFIDYRFGEPWAVAVDTSLNVYVADPWNVNQKNLAYQPNVGTYFNPVFTQGNTAPYFYASSAYQLTGVAADSTGNVYISKNQVGLSKLVQTTPFNYGETVLLNGVFTQIAVDSKGNVFATQGGDLLRVSNGGVTTIAAGFGEASGITVDGLGNMFVADYTANFLYEIPAGSHIPAPVATGFNAPYQLAADGTGNVFIADGGNGVIKELPAGGGTVTTVLTGLQTPKGVAVDVNGVLYVADAGFAQVRKYTPAGGYYISPSLPAGLSFNNSTGVISGTPTTVTPVKTYKISAYNLSGRVQTTVTFGVALPSSNLANLSLSAGSLNPAFASATPGYTVNAAYTSAQTTVTPSAADPNATITVNGSAVASGSASAPISLSVGSNSITIVVTASDNSSTQTYTVTVNRAAAPNNALLSNVGIGYVISGSTVEAVVTPTAADPLATITINGTTVASGTASDPIPLSPGANSITIVVTAQNGLNKMTYKITVDGPLGSTSTLSALTISAGALSPAFSPGTTSYTDTVNGSVPSVTVTPTTTDPNATVTVDAATVTSGTPSSAIGLNVGTNTISTIVTAQDGVTITTYTIAVTRVASTNDDLANLTLSAGTLSPVFAAGAISYTAVVANSVASVTVSPATADPAAMVTVNGATVASGTASGAIALNVGSNKIATIVTAQDGVTKKTYTITVTRESGNDNLSALTLSTGTLSPVFSGSTKTYAVLEANNVASVTVTPTTSDPSATGVTVNGIAVTSGTASGPVALNVGSNTIAIVVTAHDPSFTKTYTITVTRESGNDNLSALTLSSGAFSPVFSGTVKNYTASVGNGVSSLTVTPTTSDPSATGVTVNGKSVKSGSASGAIALNAGPNTITIIVTAHDPSFTKTYTVTVTRAPSANAILAGLSISAGGLSPAFASQTTSYTATVANSVASVMVTPTTSNSGATVTVNGATVASGSASGPLALNVGSNKITALVTAQDGTTKKTYTITVTRESGNDNLSALTLGSGALSPAFASGTLSYTASVANAVSSVMVTPTTSDPSATGVTVNGIAVTSGTASGPVGLSVGPNTITIIVTAHDPSFTKTYTVTVTRASGGNNPLYQQVSVETPSNSPRLADDGIVVHPGISPNGDGIDDFLQIDNIAGYPDNRLMIMNRNGMLVYEAKGYDNSTRIFDGHSNKTGQLQLPGTYFYSLEYTVKGIMKHKTGFLVLKY